MKQLKKITLTTLSKSELEQRSSKKLLGGAKCCVCGCAYYGSGGSSDMQNALANNADGLHSPYGGMGGSVM